jgi:hypothetical protein
MKQQSIDLRDEFQPAEEELFFDEETVQRIPAVVPLGETPTRASARFRKLRVPMRKADNSFNPAFLIIGLVAVTALGVIAGTLLYRTATDKSTNAAVESDDPVIRTIPAQYQFVVDKPESGATTKDSISKDNLNSLPTTGASSKKDSREKEESSAPVAENEEQPTEKEEVVEEPQIKAQSEDDEELPPPPPPRRDRKEDKKQNKAKQKNDNAKSESQEEQPPTIDESSEN